MKKFSLILAVIGMLAPLAMGQKGGDKKPLEIRWRALRVMNSQFPRNMGMMDNERENYATNLAGVAILHLRENQANAKSRDLARKMILVALHLSGRNRRAVLINGKLAKGQVPEAGDNDYGVKTLARLLMKRAQLLEKQGGEGNILVSGYFYDLASELDPKSEDALYHSELYRINHGEVDWGRLAVNRE